MRGKIKYVYWQRASYEGMSSEMHHTGFWENVSEIYAVTYPDEDGDEIEINITNDVLEYNDRERISDNLVQETNDDLHNVWVSYYWDEDDEEYYLDGDLEDYI